MLSILKYRLLLILVFFAAYSANGQQKTNAFLLEHLETQLFNYEIKDTASIEINELENCERMGLDTVFKISRYQPNMDSVLLLLEEISWTKDTSLLIPLRDIYEQQILRFQKEWGALYTRHFHPCDTVKKPVQVLIGFEIALHTLYLNSLNLSAKQKFEYYQKIETQWYNYTKMAARTAVDTFVRLVLSFSDYTKQLRKYRWHAFNPNFRYLTPYVGELVPFFIEQYRDFKFDENYGNRIRTKKEHLFLNSTYYLSKIQSETINRLIIERFDYFESFGSSAYTFKIAHNNSSQRVIEFLLEQFYNDKSLKKISTQGKYYYLNLVMGQKNRNQIKQFFLAKLDTTRGSDFIQSVQFLHFFPEKEVLERLQSLLSSQNQLTKNERLSIENTLDQLKRFYEVAKD